MGKTGLLVPDTLADVVPLFPRGLEGFLLQKDSGTFHDSVS